MKSSRLANIAMLVFFINRDKGWINTVTTKNLTGLAANDDFAHFITEGKLKDLIDKLEKN